MSFALYVAVPTEAETARRVVDSDVTVPECVRTFVGLALDALKRRYGDAVMVVISLYGHLHDGTGANYDVSLATIEVKAWPVSPDLSLGTR